MLSLGPGAPRGEYYPFSNLQSNVFSPAHFSSTNAELINMCVETKGSGQTQSQTTYGNFLLWYSYITTKSNLMDTRSD